MKNKVFICLLAVMTMLGFTSCQKGVQMAKKTTFLEVRASQWEFDKGANMFYCHFEVPELSSDVYENGEVSVSREYNTGTKNAYQVALPETTYKEIALDNEDGTTSPYYYCQHIDYAYGVQFVEVFITISDFYYDDFSPESMVFRLQLTW